jgi:8-oxo-dGTP pyrophosphatase MutT (NUDIX family)
VLKGATERDPSLVHREIAVLIYRGPELLWQLRGAAKSVLPSVWDIACAGHVGAGEAPEAAAHRELSEELGFDVDLHAVERRLVRLPSETYIAHAFLGRAPGGPEPVFNRAEVEALAWCDESGYQLWRAERRALSPVACELAEAFWAGRWGVASWASAHVP